MDSQLNPRDNTGRRTAGRARRTGTLRERLKESLNTITKMVRNYFGGTNRAAGKPSR